MFDRVDLSKHLYPVDAFCNRGERIQAIPVDDTFRILADEQQIPKPYRNNFQRFFNPIFFFGQSFRKSQPVSNVRQTVMNHSFAQASDDPVPSVQPPSIGIFFCSQKTALAEFGNGLKGRRVQPVRLGKQLDDVPFVQGGKSDVPAP